MMGKQIGSVIVTGDVVLDCHLYGGMQGGKPSRNDPGTQYAEVPGGAALTNALLDAAVGAAAEREGRAWDEKHRKWLEDRKACRKEGKPLTERPKDLPAKRPERPYQTVLALEIPASGEDIPPHLHSYGVWTPWPTDKRDTKQVWRINSDFGYGMLDPDRHDYQFQPNPDSAAIAPRLIVIDDGAKGFRHVTSKTSWPDLAAEDERYFLLKMSHPIGCGDLWEALHEVRERLILIVSAGDLRRQDIQIDSRLSWEQCAEHTLAALLKDPAGVELRQSAAHVIVTFGSGGALWVSGGPADEDVKARLLFDPLRLEGEYEREVDGTAYGFQTAFTVAVAHHLMRHQARLDEKPQGGSVFGDAAAMGKALEAGIGAGILAKRELLRLGHGPVGGKNPGLPFGTLGQTISADPVGIADVEVPHDYCNVTGCQWTILTQLESPKGTAANRHDPLIGRGILTARYGLRALSEVPALRLGALYTVDRADIESMRTLDDLIREYEAKKVQKKPLCIGVFGPPGAGKSFAVKALAKAILGKNVPLLEFNLSQFSEPAQLIGAFHRVRDEVLRGVTPVVFWDEFDSREYFWLQYLLAPMQDGAFQQGEITHPLGKCIFVFAGGTADTCGSFGVPQPEPRVGEALAEMASEETALLQTAPGEISPEQAAEEERKHEKAVEAYRQYQLRKGPDFISRLHGFLDVLGPNERQGTLCADNSWPIRRALQMRGMLGLEDDDELDIDPGLLYALLYVPRYEFGVRSLERVVNAIARDGSRRHLNRSDLPPKALLDRETAADRFLELMIERDAFRLNIDVDALAEEINERFAAKYGSEPDFGKLSNDQKASNRAAARRIPDHLALINFMVMPAAPGDTSDWRGPLEEAIEYHIERLAEAEHLGWCSERAANGWTYDPVRDNARKKHPLMVPWKEVPEEEKSKDREIARWIPGILSEAKHKAVPANA